MIFTSEKFVLVSDCLRRLRGEIALFKSDGTGYQLIMVMLGPHLLVIEERYKLPPQQAIHLKQQAKIAIQFKQGARKSFGLSEDPS